MNRIEIDLQTGQQTIVSLTSEEGVDAATRTNAEASDPARLQALADAQAKASAQADNVIQYLINHTPAECDSYVQTNVTDLASAKAFLRKVAIALCVLAKMELR